MVLIASEKYVIFFSAGGLSRCEVCDEQGAWAEICVILSSHGSDSQ